MDNTNDEVPETPSTEATSAIALASDENLETLDLQQKLMVAFNVLHACILEKNTKWLFAKDQNLQRLIFLTGLPKARIFTFLNETEKSIPASDILDHDKLENPKIDLAIRRTLVDFYVKQNEIPTIKSIKKMTDVFSNGLMHQNLRSSGYIWKRLPNTKRAIIMEHPKQTIKRQRYFLQLNRYRQQKRSLVYVEIKTINKSHIDTMRNIDPQFTFKLLVAAASRDGYITGKIFHKASVLESQDLIEKYILSDVLTCLPRPSVIVLEDKPYFRKNLPVPTIDSEKDDMVKWLDVNNIPHENNCHRSELFELIQKCKNKIDLLKIDAILNSHGHEVLRRPPRTNYLNFYKPLWTGIPKKKKENITKIMRDKPQDYWKDLEKRLIEYEKVIYTEDLAMENIIDKILTMAQTINVKTWADGECDEMDDSLKHEEYFINK